MGRNKEDVTDDRDKFDPTKDVIVKHLLTVELADDRKLHADIMSFDGGTERLALRYESAKGKVYPAKRIDADVARTFFPKLAALLT